MNETARHEKPERHKRPLRFRFCAPLGAAQGKGLVCGAPRVMRSASPDCAVRVT